MKKNAIGHIISSREPVSAKLHRWNILPKFICLLLALVIWLAVTEINKAEQGETPADTSVSDTVS